MNLNQYEIFQKENKIPYLSVLKTFELDSLYDYYDFENDIEVCYMMSDSIGLGKYNHENMFALSYYYNLIKGIYLIGKGGYDGVSSFSKRELASFLLLTGATSFKIFHNHPNGVLDVSQNDELSAMAFRGIGHTIDIELTGSYIVTLDGYYNIEKHTSGYFKEGNNYEW